MTIEMKSNQNNNHCYYSAEDWRRGEYIVCAALIIIMLCVICALVFLDPGDVPIIVRIILGLLAITLLGGCAWGYINSPSIRRLVFGGWPCDLFENERQRLQDHWLSTIPASGLHDGQILYWTSKKARNYCCIALVPGYVLDSENNRRDGYFIAHYWFLRRIKTRHSDWQALSIFISGDKYSIEMILTTYSHQVVVGKGSDPLLNEPLCRHYAHCGGQPTVIWGLGSN